MTLKPVCKLPVGQVLMILVERFERFSTWKGVRLEHRYRAGVSNTAAFLTVRSTYELLIRQEVAGRKSPASNLLRRPG